MTDIPIIYSGSMVRALLADRKLMTRRLLYSERKYRVGVPGHASMTFLEGHPPPASFTFDKAWVLTGWHKVKPGDRLWVRENFALELQEDDGAPVEPRRVLYAATDSWDGKTVPCIHMPRKFSRLTLIVTATKIERIRDISEADARAEGCPLTWDGVPYDPPPPSADHWQGYGRYSFCLLWSRLHGADAWGANPEVVAISFRVLKANIDSDEARIAA